MSEYIERGALIEKLKEKITTNYLNLYDEDTLESIIRFAEKQPAADVEPVVRCDNCERCEEADEEIKQLYDADSDELYCRHLDCLVKPRGFCSAGKERQL